jgi:hypothetical protein
MRLLAPGVAVVALLIGGWSLLVGAPSMAAPQPPASPTGGSSGLIALANTLGDHRQQLTVVDPALKVVSVYHIDATTGDIVLKSVRNIHWDLQMVEFNGSSPSPKEIRALIEQR